jgi:Fur family transcriptional regulator, ferric uptake regulator
MVMHKRCGHSPLSEEEAKNILSHNGLNRTQGKVRILQELSCSERPLSVTEIHKRLKESCDISTIHRSLTQYLEKGIIQEVNLEEGFLRYEMAEGPGHHHHHHVRCRECGEIRNIEKCDLSAFERAIAKFGFTSMEHRLEFTGLCPRCSK